MSDFAACTTTVCVWCVWKGKSPEVIRKIEGYMPSFKRLICLDSSITDSPEKSVSQSQEWSRAGRNFQRTASLLAFLYVRSHLEHHLYRIQYCGRVLGKRRCYFRICNCLNPPGECEILSFILQRQNKPQLLSVLHIQITWLTILGARKTIALIVDGKTVINLTELR